MRWEGASRPSDDVIRKLEAAASQPGRRGEVVLRVLDIVGANGPSDLPADVTIECVRVLQQSGLGEDAAGLPSRPWPRHRNEGSRRDVDRILLDMMSAERGASINTLSAYRRDVLDFATHRAAKGGSAKTATRAEIKTYLAALSASGVTGATQARRLSTLRQFFGFLYAEALRNDDPTDAIDAPAANGRCPGLFRMTTWRAYSHGRAPGEKIGRRSAPVLHGRSALRRGLRVSELVTLPLAAARARDGFLLIKGKGEKERLAPLNNAARTAIADYMALRDEFLPKGVRRAHAERFLFPSRAAEGHITRRRCHQMLKELAVKANLDPDKLSPHVPAPCLCHASGRGRSGLAQRADHARPCRHRHHADLHACREGSTAAGRGGCPSPFAQGKSARSRQAMIASSVGLVDGGAAARHGPHFIISGVEAVSFTTIERVAPVRIYRSKLFVPGSKTNFFEKAAAGAADCICLDLEDAVAPADKRKARDNVVAALNEVDFRGKIVTVRINGLDTGWCYKDVITLWMRVEARRHHSIPNG